MHWAAFTLIILGAAAETNGGGDALAARRRLATRPYFVPPPDLTKNWLVHGADHRGARADWNPARGATRPGRRRSRLRPRACGRRTTRAARRRT